MFKIQHRQFIQIFVHQFWIPNKDGQNHRLAQELCHVPFACGQNRSLGRCTRLLRDIARGPRFKGPRRTEKIPTQIFDRLVIMRTQVLILNLAGRPAQPFVQRGLPIRAVKGLALGFTPPQQFNQWHRIVQDGLHGTCPLGAQQIIGVLPLWHQGKAQGAARL